MGGKGFMSCNDMQKKKNSKPKAGPHIRQRWHTVLRGFSVKGTSVNFICKREEKACTFKTLVVSFLNQGHLFLGGKREMFLKARLSIKSIGCYGDHLPHRTALCVRLWFSLFKGSALSKNKLVFQLFVAKFIMSKVINNKVFYSCADRCYMWINQATIP